MPVALLLLPLAAQHQARIPTPWGPLPPLLHSSALVLSPPSSCSERVLWIAYKVSRLSLLRGILAGNTFSFSWTRNKAFILWALLSTEYLNSIWSRRHNLMVIS